MTKEPFDLLNDVQKPKVSCSHNSPKGIAQLFYLQIMNHNFQQIVLIFSLFCFALVSQYEAQPNYSSSEINLSHIDSHVPDEQNFRNYLQRDLRSYFIKEYRFTKDVQIEFTLLREGATQVGVSLPKFYIWVIISDNSKNLEGAIRAAALDKSEFMVTNFINLDEIKNNPSVLRTVFPAAVCNKIEREFLKE